jgi:hypothetical protein
MIHRTYRRLDEPPKLAGFSFAQWLALLMLGGAAYGICRLLTLPTQPAISLFTLLVGGPAALIYFSESGRPSLLRLVRDFIRWLVRSRVHEPGAGRVRPLRIGAKSEDTPPFTENNTR